MKRWTSFLKSLSFLIIFCIGAFTHAQKPRVIIDADTGNEVDDLYAIARALIDPELDVLALNSTQWQNSHWAVENTLEDSHRLNVRILSYLDMGQLPHPRGSHYRLYDWGQDVAQHSAAAYKIIEEAHNSTPENKLNVIALGALTNVASALLIDPSIAPKIRLYWLGIVYNFEKGYWHKTSFNYMMDPNAVNVVLDSEELETHITPSNVAVSMKMTRTRIEEYLKDKNDLRGFLHQRWMNHMDGGYNQRVIWDLVAIHAVLNPDWLQEVEVPTPPENKQRKIFLTKSFEADKMEKDFFESMQKYFE